MHTNKSLKDLKIISYFYTKKYVLAYILNFNKQFIKAMKTRLICQKY